jgi:hypothetical protein
MQVGNFGRLVRSKIFRVQIGRQSREVKYVENFLGQKGGQIWEVEEVGKFGWFWRSGNLGGLEVWKDLKGRTIGRILSPVINVFLQLRVDC